ncbi:hypothetical protein F3157_13350 [Virgibacillus dakarensis]|uniref:Uncharacterized protein n=1 Tax=Lentibacillus populi TaxID=1827502 RepID=A0A9W5TUI1_9BACI|nr:MULTISPECIES: hypothetical protein [Bacillaceae]MBT2216686.1 hypothetical protein [Virgibacillus dakarensis]MTW86637.1 hypothetical protein [Virgibacillus dakarensis]GGB30174.1 hypothetical protein GCM10011409_04410 [Lentibacillus populi]
MNQKKTYFVTVDTEDIREVSIPESGIEYEISATPEEIKEIEMLFMNKDKNAKKAVKFLGKPFDEWGADKERGSYDDHLMTIYQRLYDLGTEETRKRIKELDIL